MEISEPVWAGELGFGELTGVEGRRSLREIYETGLMEMKSKSTNEDEVDVEEDEVGVAEMEFEED